MANVKPVRWSFSALKEFENCRLRYYEYRVLKKYQQQDTSYTAYGKEVHKSLEEKVRDGKELPREHQRYAGVAASVMQLPGEKLVEVKWAVDKNRKPVEYNDPSAWWRGIPDVASQNGDTAYLLDYKTGKSRWASLDQLDILSLAVFAHYPNVYEVNSALLFVKEDLAIPYYLNRTKEEAHWEKWTNKVSAIEVAHATGVWNPSKNFTCNSCDVVNCLYNPRR